MALLNPDPHQLGLASPELGPWFKDDADTTLPSLVAPSADLSVAIASFPVGMQWRAPAGCTASYFIATSPRPLAIAALRQADGTAAFATGALVVLATLLPEVELRLAALSNVIPPPGGAAPAAPAPARPPVRHLALEVPASALAGIATIGALRENGFPSDITDPAEQAAYVGLTFEGGVLGNARKPTRELHRPLFPNKVILENNTGGALALKLWAFDDRGRALDPGAVANWWSFLASGSVSPLSGPPFGNLWSDPLGSGNQATAAVDPGFVVQLCSAHEGPLPTNQLSRLTLASSIAQIGTSSLYTVTATPAPTIQLSAAGAGTDFMPVARVALLPGGTYQALNPPAGTVPANTVNLFNGWTSGAAPWTTTLMRDFARVAAVDVESHLIGLDRSDTVQSDPRRRVPVARNTAPTPFFTTADAAANQVMTTLRANAAAVAMAPIMDLDWGALTPAAFGAGARPESLDFAVHALRGEGIASGAIVAGQQIVVRFAPGSLPAGAWVRLWPHGLDTETGQRVQLTGGGGLAGSDGRAYVVIALPDGSATGRLSFDAMVVTAAAARFYLEQRFDRPALDTLSGRVDLPAPPDLPDGFSPWMCEQGAPMPRTTAGGLLGGGITLVAIPANDADAETGTYALIDIADLDPTDLVQATLRNSAAAGDQLIVTVPAFADAATTGMTGDVPASIAAGGPAVLQRQRALFTRIAGMGNPVPTMERREVFAFDPTNAAQTGVVAAISGRARDHEFLPAQRGHPGMPASAEIHGTGVALAGPIAAVLTMLQRERSAANRRAVLGTSGVPFGAPRGAAPSTYAALLETITFGVTGDAAARVMAQSNSFVIGLSWVNIKNAIEAASPVPLDLDTLVIDSATFQDDLAATLVDLVIYKTRDGAAQAASSILAAIARAEDFVYIETPAIDALSAGGRAGDPVAGIDLVSALTARLSLRPNLVVLLCVPERFLPGQPSKLEAIRRSGIGAALKKLTDAAPDNVRLFTPTAGLGRKLHMASTTVIVDDAILLTGTTHLWRRGLTFDSSIAVAMFDDVQNLGRPAVVRAARLQLIADRLGLPVNLSPTDPLDVLDAVRRLDAAGGLRRIVPAAYPPAAEGTSAAELSAWNPDGRPGATPDWFLHFADLVDGDPTIFNNAIV
jgi:hypothetical protein